MSPDDIKSFSGVFLNKRVLITGHTGFKGAWLTEWLLALGADVHGFSLPPPTTPALFDQLDLAPRLGSRHRIGDIRDRALVRDTVASIRPEFIFHLAAQSLVRHSYREPVETYDTNIMGTVHVLDAARLAANPCAIVAVTTDKCYENKEWLHAYREEDPMGGHDPYSASKGAAELVIQSYRQAFFASAGSPIRLASARAGNVIGGGDWAADRIVPDCIRALVRKEPIPVRNKIATRPWQHVMEPLGGYLWLAVALSGQLPGRFHFPATAYTGAFNFGPHPEANRTVAALVQEILKHWPGQWSDQSDPKAPHEASLLNLAIDKARHLLEWKPVWNFEETVAHTIEWYRIAAEQPSNAGAHTRHQILNYTANAAAKHLPWT
ncbi:CDP-glucose 4,6-dehydratase [Ereboglobus sp. PH5-5]|uniref:CDP-glucose 4,6-dehydratase n=1 Tax=Ereboglobus sp. PH5-5 TaxID=2940529 RepID=UPI00240543CA|nr:CDP-glucose 4,6-dehydratase [Ereboglobus sp. PH5-5]MDF9833997.1 CDP-glucose 4,6-dehydratase [Ereboglobus sp. PH5-5]